MTAGDNGGQRKRLNAKPQQRDTVAGQRDRSSSSGDLAQPVVQPLLQRLHSLKLRRDRGSLLLGIAEELVRLEFLRSFKL